ncbi:RHS repeat domain-containing protein, partial [Lacinutrix sp. MEBiC02404]
TTKWLWDGNVPLHEWKENQNGDILSNSTVGDNGIVTWVFEENSFIPTAKLKNNKKFSILADHLGTPTSMHNAEGEQTWERKLDTFGKVIHGDNNSCPFMYQGQYYDSEIELAYNRFRYYDPEDGRYISVDPIGLLSGEYNLYVYVNDSNGEIDVFGLSIYSQNRRKREKGKHTRNSEYPHGNKKKVREDVIKKHTDKNGNVIDPETGNIIPPGKVSIEHKEPVVAHWNSRGRNQTKAQRNRWYNKKSNLTVKEIGPNKSEGGANKMNFNQNTGKNYSN